MSVYTFELLGPIVPKARARTTANGTYHPHRYNSWKKGAIADLCSQYRGDPIDRAVVNVWLHGKHSRRGDGDNVMGAIWDALVQAKVLSEDNMKRLPAGAFDLEWSKDEPTATILVFKEP